MFDRLIEAVAGRLCDRIVQVLTDAAFTSTVEPADISTPAPAEADETSVTDENTDAAEKTGASEKTGADETSAELTNVGDGTPATDAPAPSLTNVSVVEAAVSTPAPAPTPAPVPEPPHAVDDFPCFASASGHRYGVTTVKRPTDINEAEEAARRYFARRL